MNALHDQIVLVQQSWEMLSGIDELPHTFYARLFTVAPQLRTTLFATSDLSKQARMFRSMLSVVVENLRADPELVSATLYNMGLEHCRYGVRPEDYGAVIDALTWALKFHLGPSFAVETSAAWQGVLAVVASQMSAACFSAEGQRSLAEYNRQRRTDDKRRASSFSTRSIVAVGFACLTVAALLLLPLRVNRRRSSSCGSSL